jgi:hypothetical protein
VLFDDHDRAAAEALRRSVVAPAARSAAARQKDLTRRTTDGYPVHSFRTLLDDLSSIVRNTCRMRTDEDAPTFAVVTTPTEDQRRALDLLKRIA